MHRSILLLAWVLSGGLASAQSVLSCVASANPPLVRLEGITERTGDVVFSCSGGQPNATVTGNLVLFLSVNVTNKVAADGTADVWLTTNGAPSNVPARVTGPNAVTYNGVSFNLTLRGTAEIRLENLRANASQMLATPGGVITLYASFTGGSLLTFTANTFSVGVPQRALYSTAGGRLVCSQSGSPLPKVLTVADLAATAAFASTRVTEGFATAFAPRSDWTSQNAATGTRIIQRYSGFTPAARLFVPDFIAGSGADRPTAAGDLGFAASGGAYSPGKGQLLLVRVIGADSNGAGGAFVAPPPTVPASFNSVGEIQLTNGAGAAVYEVVDSSPVIQESAQIPTFLGLDPGGPAAETTAAINLAPLSNVTTASGAPVPRFLEVTPPDDCTLLGDCGQAYFPKLRVDSAGLQLTLPSAATGYIPIRNEGAGVLRWTASTTARYLRLDPTQGINNGTVRVDALAILAPGTHSASILIDAGPVSGSRTVPVVLTVPPQIGGAPPVVSAVVNAADGTISSVVPGSLASVYGSRFSGGTALVTFDGTPAQVLYSSDTQINVLVPLALAGKTTAQTRVSVDGNAGAPLTVPVAAAAPAIFPGGVLNQNWSANNASAPAPVGTVLQIFATGLPASGPITAKVHDRMVAAPAYAGQAPGFPGVQQVNVGIPADLPAMQTYVYVCGGDVCSPAAKIWIAP